MQHKPIEIARRIAFRAIKKLQLKEIRNHSTSKVEAGSSVVNTSISRYSFCGYGCTIINSEVGSFVCIADSVSIGLSQHPMEYVAMSTVFLKQRDSVPYKFSYHEPPPSTRKRTSIGSDVWIGKNAMIKAGVTIGHGAVVAMAAVVTKDVPPYAVVAGVPARVVRYRFDPLTVERLLKTQWWDLPSHVIKKIAVHIPNPQTFLSNLNQLTNGNE